MKVSKIGSIISSLLIAGAAPSAFGFAEVARGKLTATAKVSAVYDSNIFANNNEVSDYSIVFAPSLNYARNVGQVSTSAQLTVTAINFQDTSGQDSIDPSLTVNFNVDRDVKGSVSQSLSYARRTDANEVLNTRSESDEVRSSTRVDYYFSEKTGLRFNADYRLSDYNTAGYNSVTSYNLGGGLVYRYSPKLSGSFTYGYSPEEAQDLGANPLSDPSSTNHRFKAGLEGELAPKLNGNVSAGLVYREFDVGGNTDTVFLQAAVTWTVDEKTGVTLSASNDFDTTPNAESAENFNAGVTVRHSLTAKINVGSSLRYQHSELTQRPGTARTDESYTLGVNASYRLLDNFNVTGSLSYRDNDSSLARAIYERSIATLAATYIF